MKVAAAELVVPVVTKRTFIYVENLTKVLEIIFPHTLAAAGKPHKIASHAEMYPHFAQWPSLYSYPCMKIIFQPTYLH